MYVVGKWNDSDKSLLCRCKCGKEVIIYRCEKSNIAKRRCKKCSLRTTNTYYQEIEELRLKLLTIKNQENLSLRQLAELITIDINSLHGYMYFKHRPRKNKEKLEYFLKHYKDLIKKHNDEEIDYIYKEDDFISLYLMNKKQNI